MPKGIPNLYIEPDCEHNRQFAKGCAAPSSWRDHKGLCISRLPGCSASYL